MKKRIKVLVVFGTRPEAIKLAPLIKEMQGDPGFLLEICCTRQHTDLLDPVLAHFALKPGINLDVMVANQSLARLTGKILEQIEPVIAKFSPDLVIVQGDTTSAMVAGLASFYNKAKVAHVEAGLRSSDRFSPFPEEINRILVGQVADFHFAPTRVSARNLLREGIKKNVHVVGNTVIDALFLCLKMGKGKNDKDVLSHFSFIDWRKKVILVTAHRRESYGRGIKSICQAIEKLASRGDVEIVYATHPNPNMRKPVFKMLSKTKGIHLIDPLSYEKLVWLMNRSYLIMTDSGGIQEEAPSLGKPVLVLRRLTERMEGVKAGTAVLVGTDKEQIYNRASHLLDNKKAYDKMAKASNPYGDGKSSRRIVQILKKSLHQEAQMLEG